MLAGRERGRSKSISVSAPPFQRSMRWAAHLSRSTLTITSSISDPSSSFRSRGVVVAAVHVGEARNCIGRYLDFYNTKRPHQSLDGATPDQAYFTLLPLRAAA